MLHIQAELKRVLDLTDPEIAASYGLTPADLASDDYTRCQEAARRARHEGYEAIRYPSATGLGENLAIFYGGIDPSSSVTIVLNEVLPLAD